MISKKTLKKIEQIPADKVLDMSVAELQLFGISKTQAEEIKAGIDLTLSLIERQAIEKQKRQKQLDTASAVFERTVQYRYKKTEQFFFFFLDPQLRIIEKIKIEGEEKTDSVTFDFDKVGEILLKGKALGSTAIIISHNHPSGNLDPSHSDLSLTTRIKEKTRELGIELLDHVIVSGNEYLSLQSFDYNLFR